MTQGNIFAALCIAIMFAVLLPSESYAVDKQANTQCPAGGQVGQACKDMTNGYTTSGHCTFIGVCKADNFPSAPKASPEQQSPPGGGSQSPQGGSTSASTSTTPGEEVDTQPVPSFETKDPSQWSPSEIIAAAYQRAQSIPVADTNGEIIDSYVKFLSFQGNTYLVTPSEILKVGSELQSAPSGTAGVAAIAAEFNTNSFKTFAGLYPDLESISEPNAVEEKIFSRSFGQSTFGSPRSDVGVVGSGLTAIVEKIKAKVSNLSETEKKASSLVFGAATLIFLYYVYDRFSIKKNYGTIETKTDFSKLARHLSDKDETVSKPVLTEAQEPVIWDTHQKQG